MGHQLAEGKEQWKAAVPSCGNSSGRGEVSIAPEKERAAIVSSPRRCHAGAHPKVIREPLRARAAAAPRRHIHFPRSPQW